MLKRISLQDFVIVARVEVDFSAGFSVLTGETGAGKSILIDALQLALGARADAGVVREGSAKAEIAAEFDTPASLQAWLEEGGFAPDDTLLLRRQVDTQGRSKAWINGSAATLTQLRAAADHLVEIHGQHAWQSLARPAAVRELLDEQAQAPAEDLAQAWQVWQEARRAVEAAEQQQASLAREHERLEWQIGELSKLNPLPQEWEDLNAEHTRLSHAQTLLDAARDSLQALSEGEEGEPSADALIARCLDRLNEASRLDPGLGEALDLLTSAQAQLQDAARSLNAYLHHNDPDPQRLSELDERLSAWMSLARRYRRPPAELPQLLQDWRDELSQLLASADVGALQAQAARAEKQWRSVAQRVSTARQAQAPLLSAEVTQAMQHLGMEGGRFEVALLPQTEPQSFGLENVEFMVAGHGGATPRPLAKVASGGELSRLALALAVTTAKRRHGLASTATTPVPTLIFDEIDAGVGGTVGNAVGRLLKQLGRDTQVLAVTHLAQVAACADGHWVVSKQRQGAQTLSEVQAVSGEARVSEIARMLGGDTLADTSRAHAQAMLGGAL